jgi:hypothetical protein
MSSDRSNVGGQVRSATVVVRRPGDAGNDRAHLLLVAERSAGAPLTDHGPFLDPGGRRL